MMSQSAKGDPTLTLAARSHSRRAATLNQGHPELAPAFGVSEGPTPLTSALTVPIALQVLPIANGQSPIAYLLYPILRRKSWRAAASAAVSTPFGELPSITPMTPQPCSLRASTTSTGFALAQKMEHTSGTF